jgi:hypothetical protein
MSLRDTLLKQLLFARPKGFIESDPAVVSIFPGNRSERNDAFDSYEQVRTAVRETWAAQPYASRRDVDQQR